MVHTIRSITLGLGLMMLAGCEGVLTGPRPEVTELPPPKPVGVPSIECEGEPQVAAEPMLRLSRIQYEQTVRDLLADFVGRTRADTITNDAFMNASLMPEDPLPLDPNNRFRKLFTRYSRDVDQLHIDGYHQVASWVSGAVIPTDRDALLGSCSTATAPTAIDACVRSFISRFGARALRHPLEADEVERYVAMYGDSTVFDDVGLHDVIAVMLQAPDMIYRIESGTTEVEPAVFELSDTELASRLSYAVWDSAPDADLLAAASRGELRTAEGRRAQLDRMFDDPRARRVIERFADDWLRLSDVPDFTAKLGQPSYDLFVGAQRPTTALTVAAQQELRTMVATLAFAPQGTVSSLLTSRQVFPATPELAQLYGLSSAWNPNTDAPTALDTDRPGVFTRVGLLGTGLIKTRPIVKGAFVFDQLLCEHLGTPPPGASSQTVIIDGPHSSRQYVEALTEQQGTSCQGCHSGRLNALGFVTENFDGLGRSRTTEKFITTAGQLLGEVPIDTATNFRGVPLSGPAALGEELLVEGRFEACVARQVFRYSLAREETSADACTLMPMWNAARSGSLRDVVIALVDTPTFTRRRIEVP